MDKSTEILDELQTISPTLAAIEKINVFNVPDGYFNELGKKISTTVFLHQDEKNKEQQVPEGYFDELSSKILFRIKNEDVEDAEKEIKSISPVLYFLKDKNVFTVPAGYFDNLSDEITGKLNHNEAKIIPLNTGRKWWKYAAAAVIAGGIAVGSLQIFNSQTVTDNHNQIIIASTDIPDYVQISSQYKTPQQLDNGIATLSDNEIVSYLEKHGNILDDEILINDADTTGLPNTTDYLIDENTLNNYLNTIDAQSSNTNTQ